MGAVRSECSRTGYGGSSGRGFGLPWPRKNADSDAKGAGYADCTGRSSG
jgi:hypothetical protein